MGNLWPFGSHRTPNSLYCQCSGPRGAVVHQCLEGPQIKNRRRALLDQAKGAPTPASGSQRGQPEAYSTYDQDWARLTLAVVPTSGGLGCLGTHNFFAVGAWPLPLPSPASCHLTSATPAPWWRLRRSLRLHSVGLLRPEAQAPAQSPPWHQSVCTPCRAAMTSHGVMMSRHTMLQQRCMRAGHPQSGIQVGTAEL